MATFMAFNLHPVRQLNKGGKGRDQTAPDDRRFCRAGQGLTCRQGYQVPTLFENFRCDRSSTRRKGTKAFQPNLVTMKDVGNTYAITNTGQTMRSGRLEVVRAMYSSYGRVHLKSSSYQYPVYLLYKIPSTPHVPSAPRS